MTSPRFRTILLTQGKTTRVDAVEYPELSMHKWYAIKCSGHFYAARSIPWPEGPRRQRILFMHRALLGVDDPCIDVDHKDGDGLNNRRRNLRISDENGNNQNRGPSCNNKSGYKGVCKSGKNPKKYQAVVDYLGKKIWLGYFDDPKKAAYAYDDKIRELHGEFAWFNFPARQRRKKGLAK